MTCFMLLCSPARSISPLEPMFVPVVLCPPPSWTPPQATHPAFLKRLARADYRHHTEFTGNPTCFLRLLPYCFRRSKQCCTGTSAPTRSPSISKADVEFPFEGVLAPTSEDHNIVSLCPLSRAFCSSGRVNLYHKLELDSLPLLRLQKLLALLASRQDLTDLVQECVCKTWPALLHP
jgi:hypothetical protein